MRSDQLRATAGYIANSSKVLRAHTQKFAVLSGVVMMEEKRIIVLVWQLQRP